ncbi:hypothetical protein [Saccharibacillus alkalitolerans]|uniref:Nitroreductase domain-containing protein n=1 Tax=Saccharibacillus alkalitolerans TaxID=2705290 RepID=A0ABX0F6S7_9BACL|nr:hypothetical protein [Saccharibacillus alkalitolerans]NGZ75303.1 hypothetical protein [Saccharibacillus alkalitolerans]
MEELEFEYYKRYSQSRYQMTHLTHLTPFVKRPYFSGGTIAHPEKGSGLEALLDRLTADTLRIDRFDILSRYQDHNASPSTRNMHSCQLLFVIDRRVHFYDLYEDRLYLTDPRELGPCWNRDRIYVIGLSDLLNISRYYSEFSLYLSILDAGHVLGNAKNALNALGVRYRIYEAADTEEVFDRLGIPTDSIYGSFMLDLERPPGSLAVTGAARSSRIPALKSFDELRPTEYVSPLLRSFRAAGGDRRKAEASSGVVPIPACRGLRSSAHTMIGNFNMSETFERFEPEEAVRLLSRVRDRSSNPALRFCVAEKEKIWTDDGEFVDKRIDFKRILYNDHEFFDLQTYSRVVICYSEDREMRNAGLIPALIPAGELMQAACLYSADRGYAFRPMKNHNDAYLKEVLGLGEGWEINYIGVLCGSEVSPLRRVL